jgi:hypothetical protein
MMHAPKLPAFVSSWYLCLVFILLTLTGCGEMVLGRNYYRLTELTIRVVQDETAQKTFLIFDVTGEDVFYSPGAKANVSGKKVFLEFVRTSTILEFLRTSPLEKSVPVDLKAPRLFKWLEGRNLSPDQRDRLMKNATSTDQLLELDVDVAEVYVVDGSNKKLVWKK